jgi:hypothetical protein
VCEPTVRLAVVYVATPDAFNVGVASRVAPSEMATVPLGVPKTPVEVKVNVTDWPYVDGLNVDAMLTVAAVLVVTSDRAADTAGE